MTIRVLVQNKSAYTVFLLAAIYAWESFLYYANWWSWGLTYPSSTLLLAGLVLSPLIGLVWLYFMGFLLSIFGHLLKGRSSRSHLRSALAWSKIPLTVALLMWLTFFLLYSDTVFLQDGGGPSSIFVNWITFILGTWSFILLIGGVAEAQGFSITRSIANILLASLTSMLIVFFAIFLIRYIYLAF